MKTAVVYARYSCDNQTEQSIEGQLRVCQEFAKNNQILIVDTYIDRAMTGTMIIVQISSECYTIVTNDNGTIS